MRTDNTVIEKFEYRGYKVEIIEGVSHTNGSPYCWRWISEGASCFNASNDNPSDYHEMIAFVKMELDKKPECIWIQPYDRNNKAKVLNLTNDIDTKWKFLINDFEKQSFKDVHLVKWAIEFPEQFLKTVNGNSSLRSYPKFIQHNGFEIWFEFTVTYRPENRDSTLNLLKETFENLECKPVFNNGNMWWQVFNLEHNSFFTKEFDFDIRETHPLHGNKCVSFYINPDYTDPSSLHH